MGGIGMSAAAGLAREQGFEVLGSDAATIYPPAKDVLEEHGIEVGIGYSADRVRSSGADIFIVSSGEDTHNPEVAWLISEAKPYYSFSELLYELSKDKLRVVVAGTHGKTTTAGLLGHLLKSTDDSSFMVGGVLRNYNTNFYSGTGHYIVFEGDEYKSAFDDPTPKMHYYKGDILVLTNLEFDHPDVYQDLDEIKTEFRELVANLPDDGIIIYNADNQNLADVTYREAGRSFTFGIHNPAHMEVSNMSYGADGLTTISVRNKLDPDNERLETYTTSLPGEINVYNALAAITTLRALGFQPEVVEKYLAEYTGIKRRFEIITESPFLVIDDYAHHATAVRETLAAARTRFFQTESENLVANPGSRLWAVFEPHMYSRTKATLPELAESFGDADEVLLAPMYGAREHANNVGITDTEVFTAIQKNQPHTRQVANKQEAFEALKKELRPGDVVVVMAVGSFNHLAYELSED
jgi:UDP-N-acetylmuramate: L-alanyl-gamma-D-glutamyl-meso-diaminopimelate ligase